MPRKLVIDLALLPEEGQELCGEIPGEIFELPSTDARSVGPLAYDLRVQRFGSELLLTGNLAAPFEFTCVRTLHPFVQTIRIDSAAISVEIAEDAQIDVTPALREEILIEFPPYPRCDEADEPQHCEIDPRYLAVDKLPGNEVETRPRAEGDSRWAALDALKPTDPPR
ncbi:MAG: DUF177 domain-containing protein [Akkermansiaceae bacterium]|jgi:uncharacterized protein|nr:DUF177 domain-containing protein [Akkermansiaceae bacterium]